MYSIKSFENGFEYIEIDNDSASAKIAMQGAHIFEFSTKKSGSLLWLSQESAFEKGVAIRGGIPLCWPRFGSLDSSLPQHGFARLELFELVNIEELNSNVTVVIFRLEDSDQSRKIWDYRFSLEFKITIAEELKLELTTRNKDEKEFMITQALHTYFAVSSIEDVRIEGLEEKIFVDTLIDKRLSEKSAITIDKEIDRVYLGIDREIIIKDKEKSVKLKTEGSSSAIVWNPWIEKCSKMSFMQDGAYKEFICVESANAFDDFKIIKSEKSHTLSLSVSF